MTIPHVSRPPRITDFEGMVPQNVARELARVSGFIQQAPSDGQPATERTEAFLGYDAANLYIAFICWEARRAIRGHLTRREPSTPFDYEDYAEITLDTFHDQRHSFVFDINPRGIQADALRTEGEGNDYSWDTVWDSWARITPKGYVILISVPFKSLRFHAMSADSWGITLMRYLATNDETDYWPRVSSRISGILNQEAALNGLGGISPPRNMQFIPYGELRGFRALDERDPLQPSFTKCNVCGKIGLDSKIVFHDSLVLDTTIRPDFAQVESDEPQNTVNQRFEVFFPEKRPFFLENANFFEAPLIGIGFNQDKMVFTRRIADPTGGIRFTGKQGPWNLGLFEVDDRSPGEIVPDSNPVHGKRAYFGIGRVSYDIGEQSALGVMYTDREFQGTFNRVAGIDGVFRLNNNWKASYRGYVSATLDPSGYLFGQHHEAVVAGNGRRFAFGTQYLDITPNFRTAVGFVPRTDERAINEYWHFYMRPEGKHLIFHGPEENLNQLWDHTNTAG